jgi:hypothetical protein
VPLVEKGESATGRTDVNRLPKAVENQNLTVECRVQRFLRGGLTIIAARIDPKISSTNFPVNVTKR